MEGKDWKKDPHWFLLIVATALIEGMVQVLVTHVDGLLLFIRAWLPGLRAELVASSIPILFTIAIVATVVALMRSHPADREKAHAPASDPGPVERHLNTMQGRVRKEQKTNG